MEYFEDYTSYTKQEALDKLDAQVYKQGKSLVNPEGIVYNIQFIMMMPAHPLLQDILVKLISAFSFHLIPQSLIYDFQNAYTLDEYIIGAFAIANEVNQPNFGIIPLRQVVQSNGVLEDDFLKEGWRYLD